MAGQIWIQFDGRQQGPFTLDELRGMGIRPDTPVWYEGLPQWTFAASAPLTATLFGAPAQPAGFYGQYQQAMPYAAPGGTMSQGELRCPPTYLIWAILATLCCCIPAGLIAIYFACQVTTRYNNHDYEGALRASERAQLWIIIALVSGLITAPFVSLFV